MKEFDLSMDIGTVRLLAKAIQVYKERWPGGDPQEQVDLQMLETEFTKMILDYQFDLN